MLSQFTWRARIFLHQQRILEEVDLAELNGAGVVLAQTPGIR
jgi:hypothetical protein